MPEKSLKDATLEGVRWVLLARVVTDVVMLGVTVALARLIPPAEFGRAAVALIFVPLAVILTYEGFASALVQRESYDESHRRAATLSSLVGGAALTAITLALSGPVAEPIFGARIADLIALMSPVFLIAAVGAVPRAMLLRRLDFRRISLIDLSSLMAGNAVALGLAIDGLDARAIVFGALATAGVAALLLFASAPSPLPGWHARSQRDISAFGIPAALAGMVHVLFNNVDYAILAARLTAAQTGIYWRAFTLGVVYQQKISGVMMQVAFPVYSRTESHEELRNLHARATRVHAVVIFPLLACLIVLAPVLVPFAFGSAWEPAVVPTQILAVAGMVVAILTGYPQIMLAVGKPDVLLRFNIAMLFIYGGAILIASGYGLVAVSITAVGVYLGILVGVYRFMLGRYVGIPTRGLIAHLAPAAVSCLALAAVCLSVREGLSALSAPAAVVLVGAGLSGLAAYALALARLFPAAWADACMLADRVLPKLGRLARRFSRTRVPSVPATSRGSVP